MLCTDITAVNWLGKWPSVGGMSASKCLFNTIVEEF